MSVSHKYIPDWSQIHSSLLLYSEEEERKALKVIHDSLRLREETHREIQEQKKQSDMVIEERIQQVKLWEDILVKTSSDLEKEIEFCRDAKNELNCISEMLKNPHIAFQQCSAKMASFKWNHNSKSRITDNKPELDLDQGSKEVSQVTKSIQREAQNLAEIQRELKEALYRIEKDTKDKIEALSYEAEARYMGQHGIHPYITVVSADKWINPIAWNDFSQKNVSHAEDVLRKSEVMRRKIASLVKESKKYVVELIDFVTNSLNTRILATKNIQKQLEFRIQNESLDIEEMEKCASSLTTAMKEKEKPIEIATGRLEARAHRPNMELVKDSAQFSIEYEVSLIQKAISALKESKEDSRISLMKLRRALVSLEADLAKINGALSVDEICLEILKKIAF